jgi:hypothetical protein
MIATGDLSRIEEAAMEAHVSAEAAAEELANAEELAEGIDYDDAGELEAGAEELRDCLQTAADALDDALKTVRAVL